MPSQPAPLNRVLHILPSLSAGGIESLLVGVVRSGGVKAFELHFAALNPDVPIHAETMARLDIPHFFLATSTNLPGKVNKIRWRVEAWINFWRLLGRNRYAAVHCHVNGSYGPFLALAWLRGVPVRVLHAHTTAFGGTRFRNALVAPFRRIVNMGWLMTHRVACSEEAAAAVFGSFSAEEPDYILIPNGVDTQKIQRAVSALRTTSFAPHLLHVGRFSEAKNQFFLLATFREIRNSRDDVTLDIVGFGPDEQRLKIHARELGLAESVRFHERDADVYALLAQSAAFLLPSLWEGMPIVAIEAQVAGVTTFLSSNITRRVDLGRAVYLPVDTGVAVWAASILRFLDEPGIPGRVIESDHSAWDIRATARAFEDLYAEACGRPTRTAEA